MTAIDPALIPALINEKITDVEDSTSPSDVREVLQTVFDTLQEVATIGSSGITSPGTGATLALGGDYLLANGGTYTIATPVENATLTLRLAPGHTATVTGIPPAGVLSNASTTRVRVRDFQYKNGAWESVDDASRLAFLTTFVPLTDAGYFGGEEHIVSLSESSPKTIRNFGATLGNQTIYKDDRVVHDGAKHIVIPSSRLRNPWIRLNDLNLVEGPAATLADARSNSAKLRTAIANHRFLHNGSINITGSGIFVFADEISNVHWPNYAAAKQTVSNATYSRTNGTITLSGGGWTAIGLDGPDKVFRIEDDTNSANDGTYITAAAFSSALSYNVGDCVYQSGSVYVSPTVQSPQAFNAANWTLLGTANNVLAVRNVLSVTGLGMVKFPVNGTTASLGIVPLHTTVGGASQGERTQLAIVSPASGSLVLKRHSGGTMIRRYARELANVLTQDLSVGPGGVGASELYYNNELTLQYITVHTPNGHAIHLDGTGHSGAFDILGVIANSAGEDYPCVYIDNCYSGTIHSLKIFRCKGHGLVANTWNTLDLACRVESAGFGNTSSPVKKHGVWLINCNGGRFHVNSEGCSGDNYKETSCSSLTRGGYCENGGHWTDDGYDVGSDFVSHISFDGKFNRLNGMRCIHPTDIGTHFGYRWNGWETPFESEVNLNPHLTYDVASLAKSLPEGGLSRKRRAHFSLEDYYNYCMQSPRYIGGGGGTAFNIGDWPFEATWGSAGTEFTATANNGTLVGLEHGRLKFYLPANSHAVGYDGGGTSRSIRWMDLALPATNASNSDFTWSNSGGASVQFSAYNFSAKATFQLTAAGVNWNALGVREGMDCDITGFPDDTVAPDTDQNKPFTVTGIRDNILFLTLRKSANGLPPVAAGPTTSTAITLAFDWPEQKFNVQNLAVAQNEVLVVDVQYTIGAAWSWFQQFVTGKVKTDPQVDYNMYAAQIGLGGSVDNKVWRLYPRGPGVHVERLIWKNTSATTWSPGSPTSSTNQITINACKKVDAVQWPSATASPAYVLEFDKLDFTVIAADKAGTI